MPPDSPDCIGPHSHSPRIAYPSKIFHSSYVPSSGTYDETEIVLTILIHLHDDYVQWGILSEQLGYGNDQQNQ